MKAAVAAVLFLVLAVFLYALSWNGQYAGFLSDDAIYLLMADGFSPYRAADPALIGYVMRHSLFPPLYPLLLAVFGGGSANLLVSHWITTTTLLLSLLAFAGWVYRETHRWLTAVWLPILLAVAPGTLLLNLELFSEFPYLLFSLLALWLATCTPITLRGCMAVALCVGLAAITRSAGIALIVAMAVWLFFERVEWRVKCLSLLVAIAPMAIWSSYKAASDYHGSYGPSWLWVWEQLRHSDHPLQFASAFLGNQELAFWRGLLANLDLQPSMRTRVVAACLLLLALPVAWRRLRSGKLDAWYAFISIAMLSIYPFASFFGRLLLPLLPVLLLYACLGAADIANRFGAKDGNPWPAGVLLAAVSLTLLPSSAFIAHRFVQPIEPELAAWKHTRYWFRLNSIEKIHADLAFRQTLLGANREIQQWVPAGECAYGVHAGIAMLYGRRVVWQPPPPDGDADKSFETLPGGCRYFFLVSAPGQIGDYAVAAMYPLKRLPEGSVETVHVWTDPNNSNAYAAVLLQAKSPEQ